MLAHRRRRWANINPALGQRVVFAGKSLNSFSRRGLQPCNKTDQKRLISIKLSHCDDNLSNLLKTYKTCRVLVYESWVFVLGHLHRLPCVIVTRRVWPDLPNDITSLWVRHRQEGLNKNRGYISSTSNPEGALYVPRRPMISKCVECIDFVHIYFHLSHLKKKKKFYSICI